MGRLLRAALAGIALALVLAAAGQTFPSDQGSDAPAASRSFFASACPGGPACVDLDVSVRDFPDPVPAGDQITDQVTVQNHGPDVAPEAILTVQLPPGIVPPPGNGQIGNPAPPGSTGFGFVANDGTFCPYNAESNTVTCDFKLIENTDIPTPGAIGPRTVTITFAADPTWVNPKTNHADYPRPINVHASVPQSGDFYFDRNDANNAADAGTTVFSPGDLAISKSHSTTLATDAAAGNTTIRVDSNRTENMVVGEQIQIGTGANRELGVVRNLDGPVVVLMQPLAKAHFANETVVGAPFPVSNGLAYYLVLTNTAKAATLPPRSTSSAAFAVDDPITVTDTLPHGFVFVGTAADSNHPGVDNRCTATAATMLQSSVVTCHPQTSIAPASPYILKLLVRPQATGHFVNRASVSKYGGDPSPNDDASIDLIDVGCPIAGVSDATVPLICATKTDQVLPPPPNDANGANSGFPPDSGVANVDTDPEIFQGKAFQYTIALSNPGNTPRRDLTDTLIVRDTLPAGMTVQSATVSGGTCSVSAGVLTCRIAPDFAARASKSIVVTAVEADTGTFENLVCTSVDNGDGETDLHSCAIEWTEVHAAGDLAITKTVSAPTVNVFGQVTYTLVATNNGPSAMPNAKVTDAIQAHLELVSINPGGPTCGFTGTTDAGGTVTCNLGTLAKGQTKTVSIVVSPQEQGVYSNTAKILADTSPGAPIDIDPTNNTSATVTFTANAADLSITKTASPTVVGVGQTLTYTVVVTNNGPGEASGVTVKDPLPTALSFATATTTTGTCTGTQSITCNIGTLANAATATITIRATPTAPGTVTNTASVTSKSSDLNDANNSSSVTTRVIAADLTISKIASPSPVATGIELTYTIKVKNLGPDAATGVTMIDSLPSQVTLANPTPSQGTCFGNVTCVLGTLAPNATATITIAVTPFVPDVTITNTAQIASTFDLNSANNTASVSTRVRDPKLDVTPQVGKLGFVPVAIGRDFPPNSPVLLRWNHGLGRRQVVANAQGGFRVPMLIFSRDITGLRSLIADPLQPNDPALAFITPLQPTFRVLPGSSQPFETKPKFPGTKIISRG